MDLESLNTVAQSDAGHELELVHPTKATPLGIYVTVLGRDSSVFRDLQNEQNRRRLSKMQKLGTVRANIPLEEIDKDAVELTAACIKSWRTVDLEGDKPEEPVILLKGERLQCNKANASRLFVEYPWVREQVEAAITDRGNFLPR